MSSCYTESTDSENLVENGLCKVSVTNFVGGMPAEMKQCAMTSNC